MLRLEPKWLLIEWPTLWDPKGPKGHGFDCQAGKICTCSEVEAGCPSQKMPSVGSSQPRPCLHQGTFPRTRLASLARLRATWDGAVARGKVIALRFVGHGAKSMPNRCTYRRAVLSPGCKLGMFRTQGRQVEFGNLPKKVGSPAKQVRRGIIIG
jgi:hypothetical protein